MDIYHFDRIKRDYFQGLPVSTLLNRYTTLNITPRIKKKAKCNNIAFCLQEILDAESQKEKKQL